MIESLPKNGSFVERRKVFVQFPFHSLNHQSPFQWPEDRSSQEKLRIKSRSQYEQEYIRQLYNAKMQQKLVAKFNARQDSYRAVPNEGISKRDEEALNKQIQQFNQSKILPNNNPESQEIQSQNAQPLQRNYQSAKELNQKPPIDQIYYPPHLHSDKSKLYGPVNQADNEVYYQKERQNQQYKKPVSPRYNNIPPENYKVQRPNFYIKPYLSKQYGQYGPESLQNYQSYADLINSSGQPSVRPLRNYLPDQLEGHLRQNLKYSRRIPANNNSLSLQSRLKH